MGSAFPILAAVDTMKGRMDPDHSRLQSTSPEWHTLDIPQTLSRETEHTTAHGAGICLTKHGFIAVRR